MSKTSSVLSATDHAAPSLPIPYAVAELLPQSANMMVLDKILEVGKDHIVVQTTVRDDAKPFWPRSASKAITPH